jgi:adenine/guanine phosphoribosyltransferase-like PRPP-binding protein
MLKTITSKHLYELTQNLGGEMHQLIKSQLIENNQKTWIITDTKRNVLCKNKYYFIAEYENEKCKFNAETLRDKFNEARVNSDLTTLRFNQVKTKTNISLFSLNEVKAKENTKYSSSAQKDIKINYFTDYLPINQSNEMTYKILALKNEFPCSNAVSYFALELSNMIKNNGWYKLNPEIVVAPSSKKGFAVNGAFFVAQELARKFELKLNKQLLHRNKSITPVHTSNIRNINQHLNSIEVDSEKAQGKVFLLIDDVASTGNTIKACANKLYEAGAKDVICLTIARTKKQLTG